MCCHDRNTEVHSSVTLRVAGKVVQNARRMRLASQTNLLQDSMVSGKEKYSIAISVTKFNLQDALHATNEVVAEKGDVFTAVIRY